MSAEPEVKGWKPEWGREPGNCSQRGGRVSTRVGFRERKVVKYDDSHTFAMTSLIIKAVARERQCDVQDFYIKETIDGDTVPRHRVEAEERKPVRVKSQVPSSR